MTPHGLPDNIADTIRRYFGAQGRDWIAALPELIEKRCAAWELEITGKPFNGGTHSFVAQVRRADDSAAVLKLPIVDEENLAEATALHLYAGDGAVELYEYDQASGAMLIEPADPGEPLVEQHLFTGPHREGLPENIGRIESACRLYRRLSRPFTSVPGFPQPPSATEMAAYYHRELLPRIAEMGAVGIDSSMVDRFGELSEDLAAYRGPQHLVNRDTHLGNIVSAQREPWLLIDPKPLVGEPAFDAGFLLGIQLEADPDPARVPELVDRVAEHMAVPGDRARAWAFVRAVEEVVWTVEDKEDSTTWLRIAKALA